MCDDCRLSNPDIFGVGLRVDIYAQNFLSFVLATVAFYNRKVTQTELGTLERQSTTILITAFAILVSTILQTIGRVLGNSHAITILNLNLMCSTNLFIYFLLYVHHRLQALEEARCAGDRNPNEILRNGGGILDPEVYRSMVEDLREAQHGRAGRRGKNMWVKEIKTALRNPVFAFGSVHLTTMATVGIWLWNPKPSFGSFDGCSCSGVVSVLGSLIKITSAGLRGWSLFAYSLLLAPVLNLAIPAALLTAPSLIQSLMAPASSGQKLSFRPVVICGLVGLALINIFLLVDTETTLYVNKYLLGRAGQWSFGQVFVLLFLLIPLWDVYDALFQKRLGEQLLKASLEGKLVVVQSTYYLRADRGVIDLSLIAAVGNGHSSVVDFLTEKGANVNAKDGQGQTVFTLAVQNNCFEIVRKLCEHDVHLDRNINKSSAAIVLFYAVEVGDLDLIHLLWQCGADMNIKDKSGSTALVHAARNKSWSVLSLLVELKVDVNIKDQNGLTALIFAARGQQWDTIKPFVILGADVNVEDQNGSSVLIYAAQCGHLDATQKLIEAGADINAKNQNGDTALMIAAKHRHPHVVKQLLEPWVHVNAEDGGGGTVHILAAKHGYLNVVKQLLEFGFDVNAEDKYGLTATIAATSGRHWDVVQGLLEYGANINTQDGYGDTPLMLVARDGYLDMVKQFIRFGADLNTKNGSDETALILAAENKHWDIVKLLMESGANVDAENKYGSTSLILAAKDGHLDLVKQLLEYGADMNTKNGSGSTALILAARGEYLEVVNQLLESGADADIKGGDGSTALENAARLGHFSIVEALKNHYQAMAHQDV